MEPWYGHPRSCHKIYLAADLDLFQGGRYITDSEGHEILGKFWQALGGSWGGDFGDFNHYSQEHEGRR